MPTADPVSDLYWTVMETLTAFVRERARWKEPESSEPEMAVPSDLWQARTRTATDIAAVLQVLLRRPDAGREREKLRRWRLDLRMTDLRGADLGDAHLEGANLIGAHLERASFFRAHLQGASLHRAHLEGADLSYAHLEGAHLRETHLEGADLSDTHLEAAYFLGAHLEGADLSDAQLERAYLDEAHLEGVDLSKTIGDAQTKLPAGVGRPAHWPPFGTSFHHSTGRRALNGTLRQ